MRVEVVSPEKVLFSGEATQVVTRTLSGDIAFLAGHAPFLGALAENHTRVFLADGTVLDVAVHRGFVEVSNDVVSILSDTAELGPDIDVERGPRGQVSRREGHPRGRRRSPRRDAPRRCPPRRGRRHRPHALSTGGRAPRQNSQRASMNVRATSHNRSSVATHGKSPLRTVRVIPQRRGDDRGRRRRSRHRCADQRSPPSPPQTLDRRLAS